MATVSPSLLRRIAAYGVSPSKNPRENRLTEVFAAVLQSKYCPDLARHIAVGWLAQAIQQRPGDRRLDEMRRSLTDPRDRWTQSITTQLVLRDEIQPRRPDLAVIFGSPQGSRTSDITLWVEIKLSIGPERDQLQSYLDHQQRRRLNRAAVLLLAPREGYTDYNPRQIPDRVVALVWEDTAELLKAYKHRGPIEEFLVSELKQYLKEEGLVDPDRLDREHIVALTYHRDALAALHRLCQIAAVDVNRLWNQGGPGRQYPASRNPKEYYWYHETRARDGTEIQRSPSLSLSWRLLLDGPYILPGTAPGVPRLMAGLDGPKGSVETLSEATLGRLEDDGFQIMPLGQSNSRNFEYIVRTIGLGDLQQGELRSSAAALANWVNSIFRAIAAASQSQ